MDSSSHFHTPVLLKESITTLSINSEGRYIDATLGEAGHSLAILRELGPKGLLLSIDRDSEAIQFVETYTKEASDSRWIRKYGNYSDLLKLSQGILTKADGILMDLGISSRQLEAVNRGFSYQERSQELDMRMDAQLSVKAKDLLNALNEQELAKLFLTYGEERFSRRIARAIKKQTTPIETVNDLNTLVSRVVPAANSSKHPARRVYQALRIAVNDELNSLKKGLKEAFELLANDGRLVVISFHSLEDRIVKEFFKQQVDQEKAIDLTQKPIVPTLKEIEHNPRAHSAKLRAIMKI
ncbi:16S rRNA (cytosine(1402)-N(4))-methyltransferase RsmH [Candidatus Nomurabacteria bacterium]|nr:16S rRNA (cytosine(1402)-N(4))-methyltransferase RsmH [Candidatus Nomurabacteria bacterium]